MRCTPIVTGLVLSSIVFAPASAQAQVSINLSKITCDQYVLPSGHLGRNAARGSQTRWFRGDMDEPGVACGRLDEVMGSRRPVGAL